MKILLSAIFIFTFVAFSHAFVYATIDQFNDNQQPLVGIVNNGGDPVDDYDWWSPYYVQGEGGGGEPYFLFFDTNAALGGQRDSILGYQSDSSQNSVAILSVVGDAASIAFPLDYAGGAYFQWDGDDANGGTTAFPGAVLNTLPGIGNGEPVLSNDDRTIDFTMGGNAIGVTLEIQADHLVFYFLDCLDINGNRNTLPFSVDPDNEDEIVFFLFQFGDPDWDNNANFDFTQVAAFQVRVFTFSDDYQVIGAEQAIDSEFRLLQIFGFQVSGTVTIDCLCDDIPDSFVSGELINIFVQGNPTSFDSTTTDINGDYSFTGLPPGDYTVCLDDQVSSRCPSSPGCLDFTLSSIALLDVTGLDFDFTQATVLEIPDDQDLDCGDCSDPSCTGFATATGCGGTPTQITTWTDVVTVNGCVETIRRTWVDPDSSQTGTQIITLTDSDAPVITVSASDVTQTCDTPSTYQSWISTFGGAQASDCSSFQFTASANSEPFFCDTEFVIFTATDICGQSSTTSASYTVTDNVSPVFTTPASDDSAECDLKTGSSTTALNQWVASNGGSVVTDNCASSGQISRSNDFVGFTSSCFDSEVVTFSATDNCGNQAFTTATFTISDNTPPSIINPASNSQAACSRSGSDNAAFQSFLTNRGGATATDDCISNDANLDWSNDFSSGTVGGENTCEQIIPVVFTVTDDCGLTATTSATFTIRDVTNPTFTTTAQNQVAQCDGSGNGSDFSDWIASNGGATATDSCSTVTFSNDNNGQPISCGEATTVTFSATDGCGNGPILTTATFTIVDNQPPFFVTNPQDDSAECDSTASSQFDSWLSSSAFASISDDCSTSGLTITNNFQGTTLSPGCLSTAVVTFFANDECGNTSAGQTATFTIQDTVSPVITSSASDQSVQCNLSTNQSDYQDFVNTFGGATASDVCGSISWSDDAPNNGPTGCNDSQTVTFTANDGCGNFALTTATFSVIDSTPPTLVTSASDLTVECNGNGNTNDLNNWLGRNGGAVATDNCGAVSFTNDFTALSGGCTSTASVTFTGCDSCGSCVASTASFTVTDNSQPIIAPQAQSRTVECDPSSNSNAFQDFVDNNGGARATDVCEDDADLIWTSTATQSPFGCDSETVTFTVSDLCGRTASTSATFTILDSIAPQITTPPADVTVECDGSGNTSDYATFLATDSGAVATDVCALSLVWENNAPAQGPVGCGTQPVVFTIEDECGNSASASAVFRVVDTAGPSIVTPASSRTVECSDTNTNDASLQAWLDTNGGASAVDTCYGSNFSWSNNFSSLSFDGCNRFTDVMFTAVDPCGQSSTTSARFTIVDTTPPSITQVASTQVFECSDARNPSDINNYLATNGGAMASDSCSSFVWSNNYENPPEECGSPISITFTATDLCGNFASTVGTISIADTVAPDFTQFPDDTVVGCDEDEFPSNTGVPLVVDACDADITPTWSDVSFQEPDDGFCPGDIIITRTWSAIDDCGNFFSADQIVTIILARATGPCTPTPCPPCEITECCDVVPDQVQCNPVPCRPVSCITVPCDAVACIPDSTCGSTTPVDDDDVIVGPAPIPSVAPAPSCDPVYIYVFDDDDIQVDGGNNQIFVDETTSSSNILTFSFTLLFAIVMFFI